MLAYEFATNLSQKYQIAVDVAVHTPDKAGDNATITLIYFWPQDKLSSRTADLS